MTSENMHASQTQSLLSTPATSNGAGLPVSRPSEADRIRLEERRGRRAPHGTHCSGAR